MARSPETEKRSALAKAAVEVLHREGVDVSMARLAEALEIKRPTLLYHFPTKAHVVEHALVELLTEQAAVVTVEVEKHTHPIDKLFAQLRAVHAFHHEREGRMVFLTQAIAATAGERLPSILEAAGQVFEAHRLAHIARLTDGIARGLVAPCDPAALVATCRGLTDGLMFQRVLTGLDLDDVHTFLWAHLLAPLRLGGRAGDAV
jgi:AcrR family transcriptional regulator